MISTDEYSYAGRVAVVTGGASGMGRELVLQLAAQGCSVAVCDLDRGGLDQTLDLARTVAAEGVRLSAHVCDVSDREAVERLRDEVVVAHATEHVDLLFNNAGIHGGDSFVVGDRDSWDRVFAVCWNGVYLPSRAFLPLLLASSQAYLVNTSSLNSFFAKHGDGAPCTAYSAAKYAVRGFSEALIEDLRTHAPTVRVAVVLPGTVVTGLGKNSDRILGRSPDASAAADVSGLRDYLLNLGVPAADVGVPGLQRVSAMLREVFMTPADQAARLILDAVREGRWRILVGEDAWDVDEQVRAFPEAAYARHGPAQVNRDLLSGLVTLVARAEAERLGDLDAAFELRIGRYDLICRVAGGLVGVERRTAPGPVSAVVVAEPSAFRRVVSRAEPVARAVEDRRLAIDGDRARFELLVTALHPEPAASDVGDR
jgi:NAD(P)-dependent dehydrogenase (short-subunit alcohol dehydrogenase family)